ncbi:MAG: 50S ribosomal protein L17 [Treponema sp.]|nr:MAG: 50S ribosomal protein L17 [Treponema sp.]
MRHKYGFNPLSRRSAHRKALHRNMVTSLFKYERITTTKEKAREIRRTAEKLITRSKIDSVHNRREVARLIWDDSIVNKLFTDIGPRMKTRDGGYTRILKLGFRKGDAANVAILELVDYSFADKEKKETSKDKDKKKKADSSAKAKKTRKSNKADSGANLNVKSSSTDGAQKSSRRYNRVKGS